MSITAPRSSSFSSPISNPTAFAQRQSVRATPPDALANLPSSPQSTPQETVAAETTLRPQDTFLQDATAETTQERLSPVFNALRTQAGLGSNASDLQVLENFSTQVIPEAIDQLNERITALEQAEPSPENQLALDNARASLGLYKQAEELLTSSPLLAGTDNIASPAPDYAALADAASLGGEWSAEQRRAYSRSIEPGASKNEPTPFTLKIDQLKAQRELLAPGSPNVSEAAGRALALIDETINVYEQLERSFDAGGTDRNGDSTALLEKLQPLSQALENAKQDLAPAQYEQMSKQIGELRTLAAVFAQPGQKIEGNLGRLVSRTYRRQDQIISGQRERANETADLSGALQTFSNDAADMAIFVSRLGDLAGEIRSGNLTREEALAKARQSIPGTRADFQRAFLALVSAEVDIYEAEEAAKLAQDKIAEGEALEPELQSSLASGRQARRGSRDDGRLALDASRSGRLSDAKAHQARSVQGHETAVGETARAGEILARRQGLEQEADTALARSQQRQRSGRANISVAQGSDFAQELSAGIAGATGEAARVDGVIAGAQTQLDTYKASNAEYAAQVTQAETADQAQGKAVELTGEAIRLREVALAQQQRDNDNAAARILDGVKNGSQSSEGEFKISGYYGTGFSGMRGEVGVSASVGVKAERDGDAYILTMTFKGEASAELSTFFYSVKGSYSRAFTEGIKLDGPQEVEVFTRLLSDFTEQISANGLTSEESVRARDALFAYVQLNRRSQTEDKGTLTVNFMGQESELSVATGTVTQDGFRDLNQDGERNVGEARTRDISNYRTVKGSVEFGSATVELSVKRTSDQHGRPTGKKVEISLEAGVPVPAFALFSRALLENQDLDLSASEIRTAYSELTEQSRGVNTGKIVASVDIPARGPATYEVAAAVEDETKIGGRTHNPTGANVGIQGKTKNEIRTTLTEGVVA